MTVKEHFRIEDNGVDYRKPRCRHNLTLAFRRAEGDPKVILGSFLGTGGRRGVVGTLVEERLGVAASYGLCCEPYLRAAVCCWALSSCRTEASAETYLSHFWWWVKTTGKRSLSLQTSTTTRELVNALLSREDEGKSPRYVAAGRDVLRSWFRWLYDREMIQRSPITKEVIRLVRVDPTAVVRGSGVREALTQDQAQALVEWSRVADPAAGASVLLQASAGLRSAEVAALERRHLIEIDGIWKLTVPGKGQKVRAVILEPVVVQALARLEKADRRRGQRGALLLPARGERYSTVQVRRWAKEACRAVGMPHLSSHALRRTCATLLMDHGASLDEARNQLGHSNPITTSRCYVTRRPTMQATTGMMP